MKWKYTLTASAIMLFGFAMLQHLSRAEDVPLVKPLNTFPKQIGQWHGKEERFDAKVYQVLGVDDSYLANYRDPDGDWVNLYIGYYQSQREGDLIHSPKNCMPGGGWNIIESKVIPLKLDNAAKPQNIIKLVLQNGNNKQVSYYWYQSRGRIISSEYLQKVYLVWDAITRNRTDGSFVRLIAPVLANEKQTQIRLEEFARKIFPILQDYLPS